MTAASSIPRAVSLPRATAIGAGARRTAYAIIAGCVAATALLVVSPPIYSVLSLEDGVIESLSAIFLFIGSALLVGAGRRLARDRTVPRAHVALLYAGAFLLFASGGEEISWFQRILGIETPAAFEGNLQREMNLHNFQTNALEVVYYLGVWGVLVVVPFLRDAVGAVARLPVVARFAPAPTVVAMAAPSAAFNHEMWNQVPMQFSVYVTALILLWYLRTSADARERTLMGTALAAVVAIQAAYLVHGGRLLRYWEMTEWREFFIALLLLVVAAQTFRAAGRATGVGPGGTGGTATGGG